MADLATELTAFMRDYERATNSHDVRRVAAMIAEDATYWFTDGSYRGLAEVTAAIAGTFSVIQDERYVISELEWIMLAADHAACRYRFSWDGLVDGRPGSGHGRGTNLIVKVGGQWKMSHEHLSA